MRRRPRTSATRLLAAVERELPAALELARWMAAHPELSLAERETSARYADAPRGARLHGRARRAAGLETALRRELGLARGAAPRGAPRRDGRAPRDRPRLRPQPLGPGEPAAPPSRSPACLAPEEAQHRRRRHARGGDRRRQAAARRGRRRSRGIDVAMMAHASDMRRAHRLFLGNRKFVFTYHGRAAHAAAYPERGVNALDAVIALFVAVGLLRQQLPAGVRVHGIVTEGGQRAERDPRARRRRALGARPRSRRSSTTRRCASSAAPKAPPPPPGTRLEARELESSSPAMKPEPRPRRLLPPRSSRASASRSRPTRRTRRSARATSPTSRSPLPTIHPNFPIGRDLQLHTRAFADAAASAAGEAGLAEAARALALTRARARARSGAPRAGGGGVWPRVGGADAHRRRRAARGAALAAAPRARLRDGAARPSSTTVKPGENLYRISAYYDVPISDILDANGIDDPRRARARRSSSASRTRGGRRRSEPLLPARGPRGRRGLAPRAAAARSSRASESSGRTRCRASRRALEARPPGTTSPGRWRGGELGLRAARRTAARGHRRPRREPARRSAPPRGGQVPSAAGSATTGTRCVHRHARRLPTVYAHALAARRGARRRASQKGQVLAEVGATGNATGPHLHFEIRRRDERAQPATVPARRALTARAGENHGRRSAAQPDPRHPRLPEARDPVPRRHAAPAGRRGAARRGRGGGRALPGQGRRARARHRVAGLPARARGRALPRRGLRPGAQAGQAAPRHPPRGVRPRVRHRQRRDAHRRRRAAASAC